MGVDGYGDGDGDGSGSGDGSGYGDGDGYWQLVVDACAASGPADRAARLATLRSEGATIAWWRSGADGRPCNGGFGEPVKAGHVEEVAGPLELCTPRALHAMPTPHSGDWKGERTWIVALIGEVATDGEKLGALTREVIAEYKPAG